MKTRGLVIARLIFLWLLAVTPPAGQTPAAADPAAPANSGKNLRVLFIGNSYTHLHDLPGMVARLAASARPPRALETHEVGEGGATLKRHWEAGRAVAAIREGKWDYVVLQEHSALGSALDAAGRQQVNDPAMFYEYARRFDAKIKKAGARTVLFLTWARQSTPKDQALLTAAYARIADELQATVAPVGLAWQEAVRENPGLVLYWSDGAHPNKRGSYLAACVFYAVFYSSSPEGLSGDEVRADLGAADVALLQRVAWQAAKDPRQAMAEAVSLAQGPAPAAAAGTDPAEGASAVPSPAALQRGRAILAAAQQAAGGVERLRGLRDVAVVVSGKIHGPEGEFPVSARETIIFPGALRSELEVPSGNLAYSFDGVNGWRSTPQGIRDLPDNLKQFFRALAIRNTFNLLRAEGEFTVQYEKRDKVGVNEAFVILIAKDGESVRLWVEPVSGRLLKKAYRGLGPGGMADMEEIYSDYREVSGIQVPFRVVGHQNGVPFIETVITEVRFNSGVDAAELAKKPQ